MKTLWWLPRIFAGVGTTLLLISSWLYTGEHGFVARASRTTGTVVELRFRPSSDGGSYYPIFKFSDARGETHNVSSQVGSRPASRRVGDVVPVLYDPADPAHARMAGFFQLHVGSFITGLLGLIFGGIGFGWLFLARRSDALAEELRHSGVRIQAKVVGVEERRAITVNNRHPWQITAEAEEPGRAGQLFRSGHIWQDPRPYVKETVQVFVDRNDPSRHHVDLSFLPAE